jgi:large subunit ribosomal protein L9
MKVLLTKDVYKLGRAGDVKRVADGYGRNFLLPQGLAVLATPGALKQVDRIRSVAATKRAALNSEMSGVADKITNAVVTFPSKAGETGKLYGSITPQMVVDAINKKFDLGLERRMIEIQPIRTLGEHKARVRLTIDLNPEIKVIVHREGEVPALPEEEEETPAVAAEETEAQQ